MYDVKPETTVYDIVNHSPVIDISQYRCAIGMHNLRGNLHHLVLDLYFWTFVMPNFLFLLLLIRRRLNLSNDVVSNPGPFQQSTPKKFSFCHLNTRSIMAKPGPTGVSKFDELTAMASTYKYDVIGLTETWLDGTVKNDSISLPSYLPPIRKDRNRHGGGILAYVSEDLPCRHRPDLEPANVEGLCLEVQLIAEKVLLFINYRPPNMSIVDYIASIETMLHKTTDFSTIILTGDFNSKHST